MFPGYKILMILLIYISLCMYRLLGEKNISCPLALPGIENYDFFISHIFFSYSSTYFLSCLYGTGFLFINFSFKKNFFTRFNFLK